MRAAPTRAVKLGDPDFVKISADELTSKACSDQLASSIGDLPTPSRDLAPFPIMNAEGDHTAPIGHRPERQRRRQRRTRSKIPTERSAWSRTLLPPEQRDGRFQRAGKPTPRANRNGGQPDRARTSECSAPQTPTLVLKDGHVQMVAGSPRKPHNPQHDLWVGHGIWSSAPRPPRAPAVAAPPDSPPVVSRSSRARPSWPGQVRSALRGMGYNLKAANRGELPIPSSLTAPQQRSSES